MTQLRGQEAAVWFLLPAVHGSHVQSSLNLYVQSPVKWLLKFSNLSLINSVNSVCTHGQKPVG